MFSRLSTLSPALLRDLAGEISLGAREQAIRKILGTERAFWVVPAVEKMLARGWTPALLSEALTGMAIAVERRPEPSEWVELVITNPMDTESPARDTRAVMLSLFEQAENDLLIVGYALHKSASLLQPIADKMRRSPDFHVRLCLDVRRPLEWRNEGLEDYLHQFACEFREKHWPWRPLPEVWLDVRNLLTTGGAGHSLHAKCIVADCEQAFITSANLTEAAQYRNIETGVLIHDVTIARRLTDFFDTLCSTAFTHLQF